MQRARVPVNPSWRVPRGGAGFRIPRVPVEWLDASAWCLPSGKALAEFALQAGFLAPLLLGSERLPVMAKPRSQRAAAAAREGR